LDLTTDHCARRQAVGAWIALALVESMVVHKRRDVHDL
jgi:hypothetical protein